MGLHNFTVYGMFKRNARLFKDEPAIVLNNEIITFGELLSQVQSLSGSLLDRGIHQGDRIAILAQNNPNFFLLCGGAAAIGAIVVPINWRLSKEEIQYILSDSGASAIFFDKNYGNLISDLRPKCQSLRNFIVFGGDGDDYISFNKFKGNYPAEEPDIQGNDPYAIIYTAAVGGQPRGAVLSHDNIIFTNIQIASILGLSSKDTHLTLLPLFHIFGFTMAFSVMHVGGKNVIIYEFDPKQVLREIERERVTLICSFPPMLARLLTEISKRTNDLSSLKHVIGVDSSETITDFEKKTGSRFWVCYGQTEGGLTSLGANSERPGSAGKQGLLVNIKLVDEYDREMEIGKTGEILVQGPLVFQGYWRQDELTKHTFRNGWHHTGDLGYLDDSGYLWFVGRKAEKELIKTGGENVYPMEVEKAILEHTGIKEVAVIGVPDPTFGEGIKAICVLKLNAKLSEQELIDFVAARVARYKKPRYVSFVDSLPKKEDGSIDREKVKAMYGAMVFS